MRRNNSRGIGRMFTEGGGIAERLPLLDGVAQVEVVQKKSGPGKTRTCDIQFRKLTFCPAELRDHDGVRIAAKIATSHPRTHLRCR